MARVLLMGAVLLLVLPLFLPGVVCARDWARHAICLSFQVEQSSFNLVYPNDLELLRDLIANGSDGGLKRSLFGFIPKEGCFSCFGNLMEKDRLTMLGEEHSARALLHRCDFWLYYITYFCGGTIGLVYSNNLGQIAQSLGYYSKFSSFITLYSSCSFFGRSLSAAPDFLNYKLYVARTGWLAASLVPTPIAFFLLVASGSEAAFRASTAMIGLSSGFVFSAAVSITSELFGPNSAGVNHPVGSLLYGLLAALVYDSNAGSMSLLESLLTEAMVCMGRKCYRATFLCWGCISLLGLVSSLVLFFWTRPAYDRFGRNRYPMQPS